MRHLPVSVKHVGYINEKRSLSALYAAVSVTIVPSRRETFGNVAAESLAAGTRVVAFNTSGLRDIVNHKENGYLARQFGRHYLLAGIQWCLLNNPEELRKMAREKTNLLFSPEHVAKEHKSFYRKIFTRGRV